MAVLDGAVGRRLILLKAPAGYGKTTLAAEWCRKLRDGGAVVAWLSLDADDNEPSTFAYHLAKAIDTASGSLGREALELLEGSSLIPARNIVSALVNAVSESESETFVVLDDFHTLTDRRCHDLTEHLLRYAPSNLHLVLLSREEPALPLSRLRLSDDIVEIDASHLHFDLAETRQLLGADLSESLDAAGVAKLFSATEGWPAALQLARILLRNSPDPKAHLRKLSGSSRSISEYLEDTLATEPVEIVEFLLETSILDQLNGPACEAVTGVAESGRLLRSLDRRQFLVVPLDESGVSYRYHHLLREFLLHRLSATRGEEVAELYRRAYRWYASQEMWTQAVHHAIQARDFEHALSFIENCAMSLVIKGDLLTLLAWERQLPPEVMGGQYEVKLALAWGMMLVTRFKEAEGLLAQVEKVAEAKAGSDLYWRCKAARAVLLALGDESARGRDKALECLEAHAFDTFNYNALCNVVRYGHMKAGDWGAFESVSKPDLTGGVSTYVLAENYRLCLHGIAAAQQLKIDEALGFYADAKVLAEAYTGAKSVPAIMVTGLTARVAYERGDVRGAEVAVLDSLDLIETTAFHEGFLQAFLVLVRSAAARQDVARALGFLNRAERLAWERGWGRIVAALLLERTRLLLAGGGVDEALSLLQAFEQLKSNYPTTRPCSRAEIDTFSAIAKGLIARASNYNEDAVDILDSALEALLAVDDKLGALRVGADLALAQARSGERERAFALVKTLVGWAEPVGAVSFAVERGEEFTELLVAASAEGVFAGDSALSQFTAKLMGRAGESEAATREPASTSPRSRSELTRRERSIVEFIATGQSNKEIARELGVTPETIKTHLKRIFQKLSAETRAQAVVRAQSLGLLGGPGHSINARFTAGMKSASPSF